MKICTLHPTNLEAMFRIVSVIGLPGGFRWTCPLPGHGDLSAARGRTESTPSSGLTRGLGVLGLPMECHRGLKWSQWLQVQKGNFSLYSVQPRLRLWCCATAMIKIRLLTSACLKCDLDELICGHIFFLDTKSGESFFDDLFGSDGAGDWNGQRRTGDFEATCEHPDYSTVMLIIP